MKKYLVIFLPKKKKYIGLLYINVIFGILWQHENVALLNLKNIMLNCILEKCNVGIYI